LQPLDAERVREWRHRRMLSQQEVADRAGTSLFTIQRIERGEGNVRPRTGRGVAAALGIPIEELLPKAQAPLPDFEDERRTLSVFRSPDEPYITTEMLHERGIPANNSEVIVLNQYIHAEKHPPAGIYVIGHVMKEDEPVDDERVKTLLAYVLASDMLTEDETEAARDALQRELVGAKD
jgi:transcriptional regulator with XRE-family HTH domain